MAKPPPQLGDHTISVHRGTILNYSVTGSTGLFRGIKVSKWIQDFDPRPGSGIRIWDLEFRSRSGILMRIQHPDPNPGSWSKSWIHIQITDPDLNPGSRSKSRIRIQTSAQDSWSKFWIWIADPNLASISQIKIRIRISDPDSSSKS
jgi:hypothetical protein